jgi:hypothetical protein
MHTVAGTICSRCGARLAHDHVDTVCSPCRRAEIEHEAQRGAHMARDGAVIKVAFDSFGLDGVAEHLHTTPVEALDVLMAARLVPYLSDRRRAMLRELVTMGELSHVAVAKRLNISRWTVAAYRQQLGISDRGRLSLRSPIFKRSD